VSSVLAVRTNRSAKQPRPRTSRRDLHGVDSRAGQDSVEGGGELASPVSDKNRKLVARQSRSFSRLRACCLVEAPVGWLVVPRMCA
jgi:hypothetical protein